jgi:hypothetical protein
MNAEEAEWVIVGTLRPGGGCRVIASRQMRPGAVVEAMSRKEWTLWAGEQRATYTADGWQITARCEAIAMADGDTYEAALRALLRRWQPETADPPRSIER